MLKQPGAIKAVPATEATPTPNIFKFNNLMDFFSSFSWIFSVVYQNKFLVELSKLIEFKVSLHYNQIFSCTLSFYYPLNHHWWTNVAPTVYPHLFLHLSFLFRNSLFVVIPWLFPCFSHDNENLCLVVNHCLSLRWIYFCFFLNSNRSIIFQVWRKAINKAQNPLWSISRYVNFLNFKYYISYANWK